MTSEQKTEQKKKLTNKEKIAVCDKYADYIRIIYHLSNKIILMKQLEQYAKMLGLANAHTTFIDHMNALYKADIIKAEPFFVNQKKTQHNIILLKKFAIRHIKGQTGRGGSQKVAPVAMPKSNDRILLAIFKNEFILTKLIPSIQKELNRPVTLDDIFNEIKKKHMSILYEKNQGLDYAKLFFNDYKELFQDEAIQRHIERLEAQHNLRQEGLAKGSKVAPTKLDRSGAEDGEREAVSVDLYKSEMKEAEKKKKESNEVEVKLESRKEQKMYNYTFEDMIRANIHIIRVTKTELDEKIKLQLTALVFDYKNTQDLYRIATQIASTYQMLFQANERGIMNVTKKEVELHMTFAIVAFDEYGAENLKDRASEEVYNPYSSKKKKRLEHTLNNWQIVDDMRKRINVTYTHYDITNRYLEGIKYANLLEGKAKKEEEKQEE